ncbi:MAG TPA: DUF4328 domain-containing protein [Gemmatimonadaceae bacterium]|jgi:hypothetical protein|nr:DUF4328 domain-containing protein [Gemmatimonadaceae bacterium]
MQLEENTNAAVKTASIGRLLGPIFMATIVASSFSALHGFGVYLGLRNIETLGRALSIIFLIAAMASWIGLIVWWQYAYVRARELAPERLRWAPWQVALAWFIPFANMFLPVRHLRVTWAEIAQLRGRHPKPPATIIRWWVAFWISSALNREVARSAGPLEPGSLYAMLSVIGDLLVTYATLQQAFVVSDLTRLITMSESPSLFEA